MRLGLKGIWIGLVLAICAAAQERSLNIPRVTHPPTLEEYLTGAPPAGPVKVTQFIQREPNDGAPGTLETTAYLSYDDKYFYAVFVCKDDPAKVRAHLSKREDVFSDEVVGVMLDTFHDKRRAYTFIVNPLGIQMDGVSAEGQDDDWSFDTVWHSDGKLTKDGFVTWIAIPFKSLRFRNVPIQEWGISLVRITPRLNETVFWPHITRKVAGFGQQMATLNGLEKISPGRNIQLIPYAFAAASHELDTAPAVPRMRSDQEFRGGLDGKIVLKDALTLDLTVNPDFSQVESDEPQVTINQRFEVFFPEKRPFFIENSDVFKTPEDLFFSRRIVDPQVGARLTGKLGHWSLGAMTIDDRAAGRFLPASDPRHDDRAGIGLFRLQRQFRQQDGIGVLVTSRDFANSYNRVAAVDTRVKLNKTWVWTGQAMASQSKLLDGTHLAGPAYTTELSRSGRNFHTWTQYVDRSAGFRSDVGFIRRVDMRELEQGARYYWFPGGKSKLLNFGPQFEYSVLWDHAGKMQEWNTDSTWRMELRGQTYVGAEYFQKHEMFDGIAFERGTYSGWFETAWLKWLSIWGDATHGTAINYYPASGLKPFLASTTQGSFGFTVRPLPKWRLEQRYIFSHLGLRDGPKPATTAAESIFTNHIFRTKLNYQFSKRLSLRGILDYNAVLPAPELVALERTKRFTGDVLVTYLINYGTALHVGYTDTAENVVLDPAGLRRAGGLERSTGRQFFVKFSYLFRY